MTRLSSPLSALLTMTCLMAVSTAQAHSPYLKPNTFNPEGARQTVTVEAAFAEHDLWPDVAMKSDHFSVTGPDGVTRPLSVAAGTRDVSLLSVPIPGPGTYRISSGLRKGRTAKGYIKDNDVVFAQPDRVPPGVSLVDVTSLTRADVYVTKGKPDTAALKAAGDGAEILPLSPPWDAVRGEPVRVQVLLHGQPVANARIEAMVSGQAYRDQPVPPVILITNAAGEAVLTPAHTGVWLLQTRLRRPLDAADSASAWNSFTATLTLDVLPPT